MRAFCLTLVVTLAFTSFAFADAALRIKDPEKFIVDIFSNPPRVVAADTAKTIAAAIGKPSVTDTLQSGLKILEGKKIETLKKVVDNDFGGALRQIVYYAYMEEIGFIYFRFNFKMTDTGWLLTNFTFKSETEDLFPKDFITR